MRSADSTTIVALVLDPRGIGRVVPMGDDINTWIDSADPTGVWHYREWQWWNGHPWGESCRPRYYADTDIHFRPQSSEGSAITYHIDGFDCSQVFLVPPAVEPDAPYWDIVTSIRNSSGQDVREYGQFFACYTPLNRARSFWFWDESNKLVLFADRGVEHLDGYVVHPNAYFLERGSIPHCPRGGGKIVGRWGRPVIVSQASPAGWRSVIMVEAKYAASLAQGIEGGAMDYSLFPDPTAPEFGNGSKFAVHIRTVMLKSPDLPERRQLEKLWHDFERSHKPIHNQAAQLLFALPE